MPIIIRPAIIADQPAINTIARAARLNLMSLHWPRFLVAEDTVRIVGIGQVKPHGDGSRELASIAVVPDQQRKAIAKLVIRALLARETGTLYLTCQESMQGYYARFGFRPAPPQELTPYFRRLRRLVQFVRLIAPDLPRMAIMKRDGERYA